MEAVKHAYWTTDRITRTARDDMPRFLRTLRGIRSHMYAYRLAEHILNMHMIRNTPEWIEYIEHHLWRALVYEGVEAEMVAALREVLCADGNIDLALAFYRGVICRGGHEVPLLCFAVMNCIGIDRICEANPEALVGTRQHILNWLGAQTLEDAWTHLVRLGWDRDLPRMTFPYRNPMLIDLRVLSVLTALNWRDAMNRPGIERDFYFDNFRNIVDKTEVFALALRLTRCVRSRIEKFNHLAHMKTHIAVSKEEWREMRPLCDLHRILVDGFPDKSRVMPEHHSSLIDLYEQLDNPHLVITHYRHFAHTPIASRVLKQHHGRDMADVMLDVGRPLARELIPPNDCTFLFRGEDGVVDIADGVDLYSAMKRRGCCFAL